MPQEATSRYCQTSLLHRHPVLRSSTAADIKPVCEHLLEIGRTLNLNNLKYYYIATNETESDISIILRQPDLPVMLLRYASNDESLTPY
mgnify:CR=1 FL=1